MLNNRNSPYCIAFALLCLSLIAVPVRAQSEQAPAAATQDRRYDVELLIFKYSNPEEFGSENWPQRWTLPDTKNSVDLNAIDDKYRGDFELLAPETRSFGGMLERLEKSVRYEVLQYVAWRQRGLDKEQAVGVRIQAGRSYLPQVPVPTGSDFGLFEQSFIAQDFLPEVTIRKYSETQAKTGAALRELEGEVKIVLGRYLHVYTDLLLLKPVMLTPVAEPASKRSIGNAATDNNPVSAYHVAWAEASPVEAAGNENETLYGFNIKAHRRMRSGELHHLDHPLLGILIQIKPVEPPKP